MLFSELPYELVVHISSFLHIPDILALSFTCTYVNSCLEDWLKIHQDKLATLSSIDDRDQARSASLLRVLFEPDSTDRDDTWYFRDASVHAYSKVLLDQQDLDAILFDPHPRIRNTKPFDTIRAVSDMKLLPHVRRYEHLLRRVDSSEGFEGFLTLALLQMPRLSKLHFKLHPCHGNDQFYWRYMENAVMRGPPRIQVLELFLALLGSFEDGLMNGPLDTSMLPPGTQSLQSIEIKTDELHDFNNFGEYGPSYPDIYPDRFRILFSLPKLKRLLLSRHPLAWRQDNSHPEPWDHRQEAWRQLFGTSSIEELLFIGFSGFLRSVQLMVRSIRHLRMLVLDQRGNERHLQDLVSILRQQQASSLEILVPPKHTSNALSWCLSFPKLKHLTISYVEVMTLFRKQLNHPSTPAKEADTMTNFALATSIPETVELVVFIGGIVSSPFTLFAFNPLHVSTQDIEDFIGIVTMLASTRGKPHGLSDDEPNSRNLHDICFGDMRVAQKPQSARVGMPLQSDYTEVSETVRRRLGKALQESEELKEMCGAAGVRLHFTDLATRVCDQVDRHPYRAKKRLSRPELLSKAQALSEDADVITKTVLSRYVDAIPIDY